MSDDTSRSATRREAVTLAASGLVAASLIALPSRGIVAQSPNAQRQERPPPLDPEMVHDFVRVAHGDIDATRAGIEEEPQLVYAAWDWGGGDFETGLEGAAHMGRKDIANLLLEHGARLNLFAAATLGMEDIVRNVLDAFPDAINWKGAHGIPLIRHAQAGENPELVAYLESLS